MHPAEDPSHMRGVGFKIASPGFKITSYGLVQSKQLNGESTSR